MKDSTALEKKAEIDKLLDEFEWHGHRVAEISREAGRLLNAVVQENGTEGLRVASELYQRLLQIATKSVPAKREVVRDGSTSNVV